MKSNRAAVLKALVAFSEPVGDLKALVEALPWDAEQPEAMLTPDDIATMLKRFKAGELSAADVETWADLIELREDIEYYAAREEEIIQAIFVLATPAINGRLDTALADELMASISG